MQKIAATAPEAQSPGLVAGNIAQLKALFPELLTEGPQGSAINLDVLKALVGDATVSDADEKYGLNWHGKRRARQLALTPSTGTLRPCFDESVDWDSTQNLMIEGDNLEVLKLLQKSYAGKVKLIYIDPPYNTGKDFVYPDNFQDSIQHYLELTSQMEGGVRVSSNTDANGRFHTDWLNMMYPRLKLARTLLRDDGFICISISDAELVNLKLLCEDIFGPEAHKGTIVRTTGQTTGQDSGGLGSSFDYMLLYAKNPDLDVGGLPLDDSDLERYQDSDSRGNYALWQLRKTGSNDRRTDRPNMFFAIKSPDGDDVLPIGPTGYESCWRFDPKGYSRLAAEDYIVWKRRNRPDGSEDWWPYVKTYLEGRTKRPSPLWDDLPGSKKASIDLRNLMGDSVFDNPKPVELIQRLIKICGVGSSDIVFDFFAGSGTTGHAVMAANLEDGAARRFILVQLPVHLDSNEATQNAAASFCAALNRPPVLSELTKERLRRASQRFKSEAGEISNFGFGLRIFRLDASNIKPWRASAVDAQSLIAQMDHLVEGRTEQDLLYELLLKLGLDLCIPLQQQVIASKSVHAVGAGVLLACLAESITSIEVEELAEGIVQWHKQLAPAGETTCVFRDSAFADDVAKTNMVAILQQHGIQNVRSL